MKKSEDSSIPSLLTPYSMVDIQKVEFIGNHRTTLAYFDRELKDANVISHEYATTTFGKQNEIFITSNDSNDARFSHVSVALSQLFDKNKSVPSLANIHSALNVFTSKLLASDLFEYVDTNLEINNCTSDTFPVSFWWLFSGFSFYCLVCLFLCFPYLFAHRAFFLVRLL
jgi:hypothetical protein